MQHEAVVLFFAKTVNDLFILLRAEGGRDESLRFTAGEERGAVGAREHALADFNRANRAGVAAVDAGFAGENLRADEVGFEFEEDAVHFIGIGCFRAGGFSIGSERLLDEGINLAELFSARLLGADGIGFVETLVGDFDDTGNERLVLRGGLPIPGGLAGLGNEFVDRIDGDLHFAVAEDHGVEHRLFREDVGFRLNHQHGALGAGNHEIKARGLELFGRGIHDELVVDVAHAAGADRAAEGDAGNGEGGGCAEHGRNVRINSRVGRENVNDDLHFIEESVREERADRTVDQTARQRFLFGGTAFALEEAPGDAAGCVGLFNVVNGKREEVLTGLGFLLADDRRENDRVIHAADNGAGGLASDFTGFERHVMIAETEALSGLIEHRHRECFLLKKVLSLTSSCPVFTAGLLHIRKFLRHAAV